jgi:hypothetical protein
MLNLNGRWYFGGNPYAVCAIRQWPDGRAMFLNERGAQAPGTVMGNRVWVPDWGNGGLEGTIAGNRILWANGDFWSR